MFQKIKKWWNHEQKASKILVTVASLLVIFSFVVVGIVGVSYAAVDSLPDTLKTSIEIHEDGSRTNLFPGLSGDDIISLVPFTAQDSSGNTYYMYCLERTKDWDVDTVITKGQRLDSGYAYLMQHGYPEESLTGDDWTDSYLTQVAVWLYQDRSNGVADTVDGSLTANQKRVIMSNGTYYPIINSLVTGAVNAKNNNTNVNPSFSVSSGSFHLDSTMTYLETDYISVSANVEFNTYTVALDMDGAQVINEQNQVVSQGTKLNSGQRFKIRLPLTDLSTNDLSLGISVTTDYEVAVAYQYDPPADIADRMQDSMAGTVTYEARSASASQTVTIPTGSITISKVNADDDSQLLAGANIEVYRVIGDQESLVYSFTSTNSSEIVSNLLPGQYRIYERSAPSGYIVSSNSQSVILNTSTSMNGTVRLPNTPITVRIQKVDEDTGAAVSGAVIKILDSLGREVYRFTSTNGYTTIPGLEVGEYQAVEVSAPSGYYLDTTPHSFEVSEENNDVSIEMEDKKNEVEILKTDAESGESIAGAVLRLVNTDTNTTVDEWTTTTSAYVFRGLAAGNYRVEEVSPPTGYILSSNSISFTISNTQQERIEVSFPNTQRQIVISKVDDEGNLIAGARLAIYNSSGQQVQTFTSKTTPTVIKDLAVGNYTVREIEAPDGYQLNTTPQSFEITNTSQNIQISMRNSKNAISFAKVDSDSGAYVSGAKLRLVDSNDDVIEEWTSDNSLYTIYGLEQGTYYFEEVSAPSGYIRNTERIRVTVDEDTTTHTYTMENKKIAVRVAKVEADTGDLVAGATLQLLDSSYEVVKTWTSSTNYQVFDDLEEGVYYVRETVAPSGYLVNENLQKITIDSSHPTATVDFENEKTTVRLGKVDAVTGNYIAGATLRLSREDGNMEPVTFMSENKATVFRGLATGVYVLEEISAPSGYITSNSKITFELDSLGTTKNVSLRSDFISITVQDKKVVIDTNGVDGYEFELRDAAGIVDTYSVTDEVFTSDVLDNGEYILVQTKVPEGMILNSNPYSFVISDTGSSDVIYFANDYTKVDFEKKEMIGGDQLAGAHFILRNESGQVIEEWDSTDRATRIEKLVPGTYTLSEVKAPNGYQLNNSVLTFEVDEVSDVQTVTMFDALEVEVPNTAQNALLYCFIGIIIVMSGVSVLWYAYFKRHV